jgi:hypothetical protein
MKNQTVGWPGTGGGVRPGRFIEERDREIARKQRAEITRRWVRVRPGPAAGTGAGAGCDPGAGAGCDPGAAPPGTPAS